MSTLHLIERGANLFPLYLRDLTTAASGSTQAGLAFEEAAEPQLKANLSPAAQEYLQSVGGEAAQLFHHALAIQHAPAYRAQNADALRLDWPRIPLPGSGEVLRASCELGEKVASLLDVLSAVPGVTSGQLRPELQMIARIARDDGGQISPENDLRLEAGWGYRNPSGAVMPGVGKALAREWTPPERAALLSGASTLGLDEAALFCHLGETCFDVRLNDAVFWSGVPSRVWEYSLGGYRVLKKWLSYREEKVLGRALTTTEAREFSAIARRIAALLLLEPRLDGNYAACT